MINREAYIVAAINCPFSPAPTTNHQHTIIPHFSLSFALFSFHFVSKSQFEPILSIHFNFEKDLVPTP
jgi:hypothetical protein